MTQGYLSENDATVLVALGGNKASALGGIEATVRAGVAAIEARWGPVTVSTFYSTPAFPAGAGPDFINAACAFHTSDTPRAVLDGLHEIEATLGRERMQRWGERTLDLDLIAKGDFLLPDRPTFDHWHNLPMDQQTTLAPDVLILPHPRVQDRSFVLIPVADIAPDWVHPVLGKTTQQLLAARPEDERASVVPL